MDIRLFVLGVLLVVSNDSSHSQSLKDKYNDFKQQANQNYISFRNECNQKYIQFLRDAWAQYSGEKPISVPNVTPIPPKPYEKDNETNPVVVNPEEIPMPIPEPQPKPIEPLYEQPVVDENALSFDFYGVPVKVRFPKNLKLKLSNIQPQSIADGWETLCTDEINNTIRDCLEARIRYNLSDWAYLLFLVDVGKAYSTNPNESTLLTSFLYCQSGYQMRLAVDSDRLMMLYGSKHQIYNKGYFDVDGVFFYPFGEPSNSISICNAVFESETPLSLNIDKEQLLGSNMSDERTITSNMNNDMNIVSSVPQKLIDFYNTYPTSNLDGNPMTRWAMYANTPLAQKTKNKIYPTLRQYIAGMNKLQAAEILLNWVQTGFVYEYDDKVWGHDRAFFAEETLYYPYCDCEDRSILFSRLIRDLLGLDVALIYYPGHLATAVCFDEEVKGDAMIIGGREFIVCDPTYIGAPVGAQMPNLEYDKAQAIILKKSL